MVGILRSGSWEWALLFHVVGALVLIGGMALVVAASLAATRSAAAGQALALRRLTLRATLVVVVPAFVVMRLTAEWVRSEDPFPDDLAWIDLGYLISDIGVPVLVVLALLAWWAARTTERTGRAASAASRVYAVLAPAYLVALLVAVWAMTTKPT